MLHDDYLYLAHRIDLAKARKFVSRLRGTILDVGCGRRPYQDLIAPDSRYVGMEYNPDLRPDVVGSVLALPFRDQAVDGVLCNEVLEHVAEPGMALQEMHRVLRPDGLVYLTVPQCWGLHYEPYDFFRYTRHGMAYLLEKHGFEVLEIEQMGGLFSFLAVRMVDLWVLGVLFPLMAALGVTRGRYRLSALLVLPFNLLAVLPCTWLDRLDRTNPYGWAVLARKRPVEGT